MAYDNTNSGMLKKNPRKERETQADYTGIINVNGVDYWLNAWIKTGKEGGKMEGQKFFSLSVQEMEDQRGGGDRGGRGGYSRSNDRGSDRGGYSRGRDDDRGYERRDERRDDGRGNDRSRGNSGSGFDDMDDDIPF